MWQCDSVTVSPVVTRPSQDWWLHKTCKTCTDLITQSIFIRTWPALLLRSISQQTSGDIITITTTRSWCDVVQCGGDDGGDGDDGDDGGDRGGGVWGNICLMMIWSINPLHCYNDRAPDWPALFLPLSCWEQTVRSEEWRYQGILLAPGRPSLPSWLMHFLSC